jgi:hypothetical protein
MFPRGALRLPWSIPFAHGSYAPQPRYRDRTGGERTGYGVGGHRTTRMRGDFAAAAW